MNRLKFACSISILTFSTEDYCGDRSPELTKCSPIKLLTNFHSPFNNHGELCSDIRLERARYVGQTMHPHYKHIS